MSDSLKKALRILSNHPAITYSGFAEKMWPDNPMHQKASNGGHGSQRGKAAWLCAGSYLAKIQKKGYFYTLLNGEFRLTQLGKDALREANP
jgi:hypothetical protein